MVNCDEQCNAISVFISLHSQIDKQLLYSMKYTWKLCLSSVIDRLIGFIFDGIIELFP